MFDINGIAEFFIIPHNKFSYALGSRAHESALGRCVVDTLMRRVRAARRICR